MAVPGWWRSSPHLPLPDPRLWAFRMVTAYGDPDRDPAAADAISYLEWCRATGLRGRVRRDRGARCSRANRSESSDPG